MIVLPRRCTATQCGGASAEAVVFTESPPVERRRWNAAPFPVDTSMIACFDPAESVSRIMTPPFAQAFTFWMLATRAMIVASPVIGR